MRSGLLASVAVLASLAAAPAARAQTPEGWNFAISPYVWMAAMSGDMTIGQRSAGSTASFGDLLGDLRFGVMGAAEVRFGRFGVVADLMYLDLQSGVNLPADRAFSGGQATLRSTTLTLEAMYRVVDEQQGWLDIGAGIRPWWVDPGLRLNAGALPGRTLGTSVNWTDPIIAMRGHVRLGQQFGLTVYGDIGGFGAGSQLTWQVMGTIDWNATQNLTARAGWRYMAVDFQNGRASFDLTINGPILGLTYRF